VRADALVLFGATGDLAKRKLFPALYHLERHGGLDVPVVGVARSDWDDDRFREHARNAIEKACDEPNADVLDGLLRRMRLVGGDYSSLETFSRLAQLLDEVHSTCAVFYLAIPPAAFPNICQSLAAVGLHERGRVVVEPASSTGSCTRPSRRSASSASITTSARRASKTSSSSGSPTRCWSRSGTATTSPACR